MESNSTSGGVLRRKRQLPGSLRHYPYNTGSSSGKEDMKEEVVRLGVRLSLSVVESMFLLCDDVRTMLCFCYKLWRDRIDGPPDPVLDRLLRVMHNVYSKYIKQKNGVYRAHGNSVRWELVSNTWKDFAEGILVMNCFVFLLRRKKYSFDDRLLLSGIAEYKQVLKRLEDKLRFAKDVSEANGFVREAIEDKISDLWKSLFSEEAKEATWTVKVIRRSIISDLFTPISGKPFHRKIRELPALTPYILGEDFAKQQLKEEVVRLGVEIFLYVAESMFLLCDDIRTMLWFCYKLWKDAESQLCCPDCPLVERLLCVMHYVYSEFIKPKNCVFQNDGKSVQWRLITTTWENFADGIMGVHRLVLILRGEGNYIPDIGVFLSPS